MTADRRRPRVPGEVRRGAEQNPGVSAEVWAKFGVIRCTRTHGGKRQSCGGVEERTGGGKPGTTHREAKELAGVLAKLEATEELQSGGTTLAELRGLVEEDDPTAELES